MLERFQTLFIQIKSLFFIILCFSRLQQRIVITVSLCNSIFLATDIWREDIINLFLVHFENALGYSPSLIFSRHLCSPGGIYSLPQITHFEHPNQYVSGEFE